MTHRIDRRASRALVALSFVVAALTLGACNTTEGFGHDVQNTGHAISNSAEEHKPN